MNLPIVPLATLLMVFGVPYLVIYLQGRRLSAMEARLAEVTHALGTLEAAVQNGRNVNA